MYRHALCSFEVLSILLARLSRVKGATSIPFITVLMPLAALAIHPQGESALNAAAAGASSHYLCISCHGVA